MFAFCQSVILLQLLALLSPNDACMEKAGVLHLKYEGAAFEIGSEMRINCELLNNTYVNANKTWHTRVDHSNLRFRLNSQTLDETSEFVEKVDENTIAFVKKNAQANDSAKLMCYGVGPDENNRTTTYAGCFDTFSVGKRPEKVANFSCTSNAFVNMSCSWDAPPNKVQTKYTIEISSGVLRTLVIGWKACPPDHRTATSCMWTPNTSPAQDKMAREFYFRINGTNALGSDSWEYNFDHGSIVKLSPVNKLRASQFAPRRVNITWEAPDETEHGGWKSDLPIIYTLDVSQLKSKKQETFETSERSFTLSDLVPNTAYEFSVRAKTNATQRLDLNSEPSHVRIVTPKAKPDRPPQMQQSSFKYKLFNSVRTVTLLFDEVPRANWNDDSFSYLVQVCSSTDGVCFNKSSEHTNFELEGLSTSQRYFINVWSVNSLGHSASSSEIVIGPQNQLLPVPSDVTVLLADRSVRLSWKTPQTLRDDASLRADVFWCESHNQQQCQGKVHQLQVANNDSHDIPLPDPRDYIYGVALSRTNGPTSGSVWSVCEINPRAHVGQVRELEVLPNTDTSLRLHWRTGCGYQRKNVEGYQVEYCRVKHDPDRALRFAEECQHQTPKNASAVCRLANFTLADPEDVYVLDGLDSGEVYRVVLRAIDGVTHQFAPDSMAVCALPRGMGVAMRIILGIVVTCAFIVMVIMISLYIVSRWMEGKVGRAKASTVRLPKTFRKTKKGVAAAGVPLAILNENGKAISREGSHSSLDKLISTSISSPPAETKNSLESANLKGEPQVVLNLEHLFADEPEKPVPVLLSLDPRLEPRPAPPPPPAKERAEPAAALAAAPPAAPEPEDELPYMMPSMPPYTKLGMSATHFVQPLELPGNTGYSQLSVRQNSLVAEGEAAEEPQDEGVSEQDDEERAPSPEAELVPRPAVSSYISFDRLQSRAASTANASN